MSDGAGWVGMFLEVDTHAFHDAVQRLGILAAPRVFSSCPRWVQAAFWAGGEDGLRTAHEAGAPGQAAVEAALVLGGKDAVAAVLRTLAQGTKA